MANNLPPISVLPNEILLEIFTRGIEIETQGFPIHPVLIHSPTRFAMNVSSVCRSWRALAVSTPSLWTTVVVTSKQRAQLFLERSLDLPISLHIYSTFLDAHEVVTIIAPHFSRSHSLAVKVITPKQASTYTEAFFSFAIPHLEDLTVVIASRTMPSQENGDIRIIRDVDVLKSLTVKAFSFPYDCASDWRNLTFLNVRNFQPTYTQFSQLFQNAPLLETVYLPNFRWLPDLADDVQSVPAIEASALKEFRVGLVGGHDVTRCDCPLSLLHMPNLQSLAVIGRKPNNTLAQHFSSNHATNDFTKLKHLQLAWLSLTPRDVRFFRRLNNLRRLELDRIDGELSLNLAQGFQINDSDQNRIPFPSLESITIVGAYDIYISWLEKRALVQVQSSQLTIGLHSSQLTVGMVRGLMEKLKATTSSVMEYKLVDKKPPYYPLDLNDPWNDGMFDEDDDDEEDDEEELDGYDDYDAFDDFELEVDSPDDSGEEDGYNDYEDTEEIYEDMEEIAEDPEEDYGDSEEDYEDPEEIYEAI
ncbi:hypothetical protein V5O48_003268 [Marasmius crinis-equi]|uniref:F-box domain-containing protein n=1 Tax=Marasmius crinis-equi TaxID=585013 RepID=A0ABR3FU28_9AGAR